MLSIIGFSTNQTQLIGNGAMGNPVSAFDADLTTFVALTASGGGGVPNQSVLSLIAQTAITRKYQSATLKVRWGVPVNSGFVVANPTTVKLSYGILGVTGALTSIATLAQNVTQATITSSVALSTTQNLSQLVVSGLVSVTSAQSVGSVELDIYEAWVEVIE